MGSVRDRWRSHLLQTLSGTDDGRPPWVDELVHGDDALRQCPQQTTPTPSTTPPPEMCTR